MTIRARLIKNDLSIGHLLGLPIVVSLLIHAFFLLVMSFMPTKVPLAKTQKKVPVKLQLTSKAEDPKKLSPSKAKTADPEREQRIVEAPLLPTEKPDRPAYLGAQDHRTSQESKTQPKPNVPGAEATPIQNGLLRLETEPVPEGRIKVPAGKNYRDYLPQKIDIVNNGHNDFFPDNKLKIGPVIDVNTTDFRYIAYFTAVRKQVELAYYDIGPSLQEKSYVREKIDNLGKARLQGSSVVQVKVARSGLLIETKLVDSSGEKDVDTAWIRILNLAAPFPPLPRDFPDEELSFTYKLYYDLSFQGDRKTKRFTF